MVSAETLLRDPDQKLPFTFHNNASDKKLGDVISQKNRPIAFFSTRFNKTQRNYTKTEKELIVIVEHLKKFCGILFGYEIDLFLDHKTWSMPQP